MFTYLITGANGHLGGTIVRMLLNTDCAVRGLVLPGEKARPILKTYGFNISRMEKQPDGGYHWISREVSYYQDVKTGKLI
ncbi:MAG: DUF1838 family protein, partial [Clostridia bacterium]